MLPKINRLKREDFPKILKTGRRVRGKFLTLFCQREKNENPPKMGIILTKKAFKSAVARNKAKRRIRNVLIEEVLPQEQKGFSGIIMVYQGFSELKYAEIRAEIKKLLAATRAK